jgi:hypothetical protein
MRPPDPHNARRPSSPKPGPVSQYPISQSSNIETYTTPLDLQARRLRRQFAIGDYLAASLAILIWGMAQ